MITSEFPLLQSSIVEFLGNRRWVIILVQFIAGFEHGNHGRLGHHCVKRT
jgi:hypothetical protein